MHQLTTVSCLPSSQLDKLLLLFIHLPLHLHQDLLPYLLLLNMLDFHLPCTYTRTYSPLCSCSTWWTTTSPCTCTRTRHGRTFSPLCSCSTRWTFPHIFALWPGPVYSSTSQPSDDGLWCSAGEVLQALEQIAQGCEILNQTSY